MKQLPMQNALPDGAEKIRLCGTFRGKYRVFAAFLICCAILLAGFAVSAVFSNGQMQSLLDKNPNSPVTPPSEQDVPPKVESPAEIPDGATPIVSYDLSATSKGPLYIQNETPYRPDVAAFLSYDVTPHAPVDGPLVLILHTHTSEGYLPTGTQYLSGEIGDASYTDDPLQNVLSAGEELTRVLNEHGIGTMHCKISHDTPTLSGSYDRSAETICRYLEAYPTIEYVIDLHRDAVLDSDGALVRAVSEEGGDSVAQVMAVVGTDINGTAFDWSTNFALALHLRELLNADGKKICRPVSLRNASFHQELARYSLLLEIGTSANSPEEAKCAARRVGDALAQLIYGNENKPA